ncbi:MAG: CBS domain-containing protein [Methanofollis sp.]|uniref:CBS domain-containing protein n=1 Tax=Methanofollis sp. TaxID=2052835 RepID=UPI0026335DBD|nr:CBS domain-containing protein [Methanofollis sp.]MDD4253976.1 CBS domain-containing protein [Methanofollis sp.]
MHKNNQTMKQGDRLLKMPGKLDRGPIEFKSRIAGSEGEVMGIATRGVISVPQTMTIIGAVETMTAYGFRRLPITDAGTHRLRGIVTARDIIDFLGGGDRFNLVRVKHSGNLLSAINESVREVMTQRVTTMPHTATIAGAAEIIVTKKIGGLPIVDEEEALAGIVTERDVMKALATEDTDVTVEGVMSTGLRVTGPDTPIGSVTREMIAHGFRRLPLVSDDVLFGIISASDIMKYLGSGEIFTRLSTGNVAEVMGLPVRTLTGAELYTTTPNTNINDAALKMLQKGVGALPVIEEGKLIGLITEFDLVKAFYEE